MQEFCTLFDSNYLTRALAMYRSLERTGEDFRLYAVCFDELAYELLGKLNLPQMVLIPLPSFESEELLRVKKDRTAGEYCWTCTPHVIRYVLETYGLQEVTYVDADLKFYARPSLLLDEFRSSGASVLITEHRYTPRYDLSARTGIYCVQFMTFKADENGLKALSWWQERCLEWCYARLEDGKFGDQKYLDDWPQRFEGVHILQHLGGGVAPWNIQQYALERKEQNGLSVDGQDMVFYHFHNYREYADGTIDLGHFRLSVKAVDLIYRPYAKDLDDAGKEIRKLMPDFNRGKSVRSSTLKDRLRRIRHLLRGELNEYSSL